MNLAKLDSLQKNFYPTTSTGEIKFTSFCTAAKKETVRGETSEEGKKCWKRVKIRWPWAGKRWKWAATGVHTLLRFHVAKARSIHGAYGRQNVLRLHVAYCAERGFERKVADIPKALTSNVPTVTRISANTSRSIHHPSTENPSEIYGQIFNYTYGVKTTRPRPICKSPTKYSFRHQSSDHRNEP